jgi:hypothetical protein
MKTPKRKFETERTRYFRAQSLDKQEENTISHIERSGCSILHITSETKKDRPLFSYTVGLFDTGGGAELITTGLLEQTAHSLLNGAADRLREGIDLKLGRQSGMIGDVECEFRPVDPKWVKHLMGWATWYNGSSEFPVLQAVYPDGQNRFPEDEGFNTYFAQPLMQPDAPMTRVEEDFWAENDPESSLSDWKFPDSPHTGVFLSKTVHDGTEEVTYVSHDPEDGAWQFLGDSMEEGGGPVLSCFHHSIDKDPSLKELFDLPIGWSAERAQPGAPWIRKQLPPAEADLQSAENE